MQCHTTWIQLVALYPQLRTKPMCLWDFYTVQVSAKNRQTDVSCWIFAWNAVTSMKYTMLYLQVNLWDRSSTLGYGAEACVFFWHEAPSKFFRCFFTTPAKRAPHKSRTDRRAWGSCHKFEDCFLCCQGSRTPATSGVSNHFLVLHLHPFLFHQVTRNNADNKNTLQV